MGMTRDATLDEVCALIALMSDAKVVGHEWSGDHARIVVHVAGDALEALARGADVLLFDYPGYGDSTGTPTAALILESALAVYDWVTFNEL